MTLLVALTSSSGRGVAAKHKEILCKRPKLSSVEFHSLYFCYCGAGIGGEREEGGGDFQI